MKNNNFYFVALLCVAVLFLACEPTHPVDNPVDNPVDSWVDENGALCNGEFSISPTQKVRFSRGNLQYNAKKNVWRFANYQGENVGEVYDENNNISSTYDGWIDRFCWGSSGYNGRSPWMTNENYSDYNYVRNDIAGTNYDWGVYNPISNGGNKAGMWRTLTKSEWQYLLWGRSYPPDPIDNFITKVAGRSGLVLLPDNWTWPSSLTVNWNGYTGEEWDIMQAEGAVFLPVTTNYNYEYDRDWWVGDYWTSSYKANSDGDDYAWMVKNTSITGWLVQNRNSVRLVQDVK